MKIETLCENPWVTLKQLVAPEMGVKGYVFSHETRCRGHIVSILPYKLVGSTREFLLRSEYTPCWDFSKLIWSSITGGWEGGDFRETVQQELREEAGYEVRKEELIDLGTCFGAKSTDTVYHLFSINLTGKEQLEATTDGSELEKAAKCVWVDPLKILEAGDPMVYVSYVRLGSR